MTTCEITRAGVERMWLRRVALVVVGGILLRMLIAFAILPTMPQVDDGPNYARQASDLLSGTAGFSYFPPGTSLFAVPVYALFGNSVWTNHLIGVLLTSGFLLSGVWFSRVLLGWSKATFFAAVMLALYPHSVLSATQLSSEPLTAIFLACAMGLMIRNGQHWSWARWFGVAVCFGGAALTRPASLAVLPFVGCAAFLLWRRGRISGRIIVGAAVMLLAVGVLMALPFAAHNARMGQGATISTNNEFNLFVGNNPYSPDYKTGQFGQRRFDDLPAGAREYMYAALPQGDAASATQKQRTQMRDAAITYMRQHPDRTLYRISNRARGFWGMDYTAARGIQDAYGLPNVGVMPLLALEGGGYLLVLVLAVTAPFLVAAAQRSYWPFILGCVVAFMVPYLLAFALAKYHLPTIPLLIPIAAVAGVAVSADARGAWRILRRNGLWWTAIAAITAIQVEHLVHVTRLQ